MLTLLGVFAAGLATLATPCVLPLVPVYLTMLLGGSASALQDRSSRWRLLTMTAAFAAGFTLVFAALGLGASSLGGLLQQHRGLLTLVGAALIVLFGLKFMGLLPLPWLDRDVRLDAPRKIAGPLGGFGFGLVFGLGWTPCAGPVLASVLSLAALEDSALAGAGLLTVYSAGLALPLLVVAGFADRAVPLLRRLMARLEAVQKLTGAALVGLGLFLGWAPASELLHPPTAPLVATTEAGETLQPVIGDALHKPRLVELVEEGCPVCARMAPRIAELAADCTEQRVDVHTVDLSRPENRHLRQALAVNAVPTLLLIDDQGAVRHRLIGERSLDEIRGLAAGLQASSCAGVEPLDATGLDPGEGCASDEDGLDEAAGSCS